MRALKILVIAMGILLIVGFAAIAGRIIYILAIAGNDDGGAIATTGGEDSAPGVPVVDERQPFAITLNLPRGSQVRDLAATSDRITVLIQQPGQASDLIYILDPKTGIITGSVTFTPE